MVSVSEGVKVISGWCPWFCSLHGLPKILKPPRKFVGGLGPPRIFQSGGGGGHWKVQIFKKYDVHAIVKYTILCTGETKVCKLTKILPILLLDFHDSREGFDKGRGMQGEG